MKRFVPVSLAIVLLFFVPSFAQDPTTKPPAKTEKAADVKAPAAPTGLTKHDYPFLSEALTAAEFEGPDGIPSVLPKYKGKVVAVNLWAIWCGPCRKEMPLLQGLFDTYHKQGLEVIGLNIGDFNRNAVPFEDIQTFADWMNISYPLGRASPTIVKEIYRLSNQPVVPQTILIDRDGRLRGVFVGGSKRVSDALSKTLENLMTE